MVTNHQQAQKSSNVIGRTKQQEEAISQLQDSIDANYRTIYELVTGNDRNDLTIIKTIQQLARNIEETFRLRYENPDLQISYILEYIIKGCRVRNFTDSQCRYVYEAFTPPEFAKYKRLIDHSSSESFSNLKERREDSSIRFANFKKHIDLAYSFIQPIGLIEREYLQRAANYSLDKYDDFEGDLEIEHIATIGNIQEDAFNFPSENTQKIQYGPTTPCKSLTSEACKRHGESWIEVGKKIEHDGRIDPETGTLMFTDEEDREMSEALDVWTEMHKPFLDEKWRLDHYHWADVILKATQWFKHTASTASRVQTFDGLWRCVTREHIGTQQERLPLFYKRVISLTPHYLKLYTIFMRKVRQPREAKFSIRLSPKLSEQSMR